MLFFVNIAAIVCFHYRCLQRIGRCEREHDGRGAIRQASPGCE